MIRTFVYAVGVGTILGVPAGLIWRRYLRRHADEYRVRK